MEFMVLGLLMYSNMTIYQINASFKEGLSLIYSPSYGSIQNAIKKLLKAENIAFTEHVEKGRNKKTYHLTDKGRASFFNWITGETPLNKLETSILSKVYFLSLIEEKDVKLSILNEMLEKVKGIEGDLKGYQNHLKTIVEENEHSYYQLSTLDYGVRSHSLGVEWLEEIIRKTEHL